VWSQKGCYQTHLQYIIHCIITLPGTQVVPCPPPIALLVTFFHHDAIPLSRQKKRHATPPPPLSFSSTVAFNRIEYRASSQTETQLIYFLSSITFSPLHMPPASYRAPFSHALTLPGRHILMSCHHKNRCYSTYMEYTESLICIQNVRANTQR